MLLLLLLCCAPAPEPPADPEPSPALELPPPPPPPVHLRLVATGDVLPHRAVKATAAEVGWDQVFADLAPRVQAADLAFANLESPVAPDAHQGTHGEIFDAPASLLQGLAQAGFDVLALANNHAWDQGPQGLSETLRRVEGAGMTPVGAGPTCAAAQAPQVVEVQGVRVGFVAFTDLVNHDVLTATEPCLFTAGPVCEADCGPDRDAEHYAPDLELLRGAVAAASREADLVVVSAHWGDEYRAQPLPEYPVLARELVDAGAHVVLGHHPHVLQPIRWVEAGGRRGLVAFSLGNMVSNMGSRFDPVASAPRSGRTRDGLLLELDVVHDPATGHTHVQEARAVPLWTSNNHLTRGEEGPRVVVSPHDVLWERARSDSDQATLDLLDARWEDMDAVLGEGWLQR